MSDQAKVIPVILHCPHCKKQHIDEGIWATRPHRTHQCVDDAAGKGCQKAFTPSTYRTVGVLDLKGAHFDALDVPDLGMKPDTRSQRWRDAESRCGPNGGDPVDLAIVAEEQAKWDEEHAVIDLADSDHGDNSGEF